MESILNLLMDIHARSEERQKCGTFVPTLVFNEGWLLRGIFDWWMRKKKSDFPFVRFDNGAKFYAEGQLETPFRQRPREWNLGRLQTEKHTHVDGIIGHFLIRNGTKSGIELQRDCSYLTVFEAKIGSGLSRGVTNAEDYDQLSRIAACMIYSCVKASISPDEAAALFIVLVFPDKSRRIIVKAADEVASSVERQIEERIRKYADSDEELETIGRRDSSFASFRS